MNDLLADQPCTKLSSPIVIVDVGARGGIHERWKGLPVRFVGFEPDPSECKKLNNPPNEIYLPYALWSEPAQKSIHLVESPHGASLFEHNYEFINNFVQRRFYQPKGTASFDVTPIDSALSVLENTEVDVLKIDTEGAEGEILKGAGHTLQQALVVELEVWFNPVLKGAPFFADIDPVMRAAGFQLFDLAKSNFFQRAARWPKGQLVAADALYFKVGESMDRERLDRFLSIVLAYGYYDYALSIVDEASNLSPEEKETCVARIECAGKRIRFRGQARLARFFGRLARRLATVEKDHLGND